MAGLSLYNPFRSIDRLEPFSREMEDIFKGFFLNGRQLAEAFKGFYETPATFAQLTNGRFPIDVSEDEKSYTVRAELPGFQKEEIKVSVEGNQLCISAETRKEKEQKKDGQVIVQECYCGKQYRAFTLPQAVDDTKSSAKYSDGVLELTLPKREGAATATIAIK